MKKLTHITACIAAALLVAGCASKPKNSWVECIDNEKALKTFQLNGQQLTLTQCSFPKADACEKGTYKHKEGIVSDTITCQMPLGGTCSYFDDEFNKRNLQRLYGLRRNDYQLQRCTVDAGFLAIEGEEIMKIYGSDLLGGSIMGWRERWFKLFGPEVNDGLLTVAGVLIAEPHETTPPVEELRYRARLLDGEGDLLREWPEIQPQRISNLHTLVHGEENTNLNRISYRQKTLFMVGQNLAFVTTDWKGHEDYIDYPGLHWEDEETWQGREGESRQLHLIDPAMKEVAVLEDNEFLVQPMVIPHPDGARVHWTIIGPLADTPGLYGVLQEDGSFQPPPGTLGVRPLVTHRRLQETTTEKLNPGRKLRHEDVRRPHFWLTAYYDGNGGRNWGIVPADMSEPGEPLWSRLKEMPDGWMFAQRIEDGQWEFFGDIQSGLESRAFATPAEGFQELTAVLEQREAKRQAIRDATHARWARQDKAQKDRYYSAKQRGDVAGMRKAMFGDTQLQRDFYLSGHGSIAEMKKFYLQTIGNDRELQQSLEQREEQAAARAAAQFEAESRARAEQKRQQQLEQWRNKRERRRKEYSEWREKVNTNVERVNREAAEAWHRHKVEMYKKGFIDSID
jgi:hypothetical protein